MRISDWISDVCSSDLMDVVVQIEDPQQPGRNLYETARVPALMHHPLDRYNVQVAIEWYSGYDELQRLTIVDVDEEWRQAQCGWLEPLYPLIQQTYPTTIMDVEPLRSAEHPSDIQSLLRHSYDFLCLKKKNNI